MPHYVTEEDKKVFIEIFRRGGFTAPTCWYKVMMRQLAAKDDQSAYVEVIQNESLVHSSTFSLDIPPDRTFPPVTSPIFFGAASNDYVCLPAVGHAAFKKPQFRDHKITQKEYDADHWLILSKADEIAHDLEAWIEESGVTGKPNRLSNM
jgi:soluble epoxide hydrolase / lipid-phosphate phosphatase